MIYRTDGISILYSLSLYTRKMGQKLQSRLIHLCEMTQQKIAVRKDNKASNPFATSRVFRQEDALSCDLFHICLKVKRRAIFEHQTTFLRALSMLLEYAFYISFPPFIFLQCIHRTCLYTSTRDVLESEIHIIVRPFGG